MEAHEYQTLFEAESSYWWYRALRGVLLDVLKQQGANSSSRVLDAGCGTGRNLQVIQERITPYGFGFDLSHHAAQYWPRRGLRHVCLAAINEIPFQDAAFDVALCIDVLEHVKEVLEAQAYRELWRVVRPGGFIVLVVPAYPWLFNEKHHKAVHAWRRYTKRRLASLFREAPVRAIRVTHLFPSLFPVIAGYRLLQRLLGNSLDECSRSDLRPLPPLLNELLFRIVEMERSLLCKVDFPFGSSILAVVQKQRSL